MSVVIPSSSGAVFGGGSGGGDGNGPPQKPNNQQPQKGPDSGKSEQEKFLDALRFAITNVAIIRDKKTLNNIGDIDIAWLKRMVDNKVSFASTFKELLQNAPNKTWMEAIMAGSGPGSIRGRYPGEDGSKGNGSGSVDRDGDTQM